MMKREMLEKISEAIGKSPEETEKTLNKNPKLKMLLSNMSEQDAQKLMEILGNKESITKILSTPQAKTLLESMNGKGEK